MNFKKTCRSETRSISKRLLLAGPPIIAWSWGKEKSKTDRSWFDQTSKVQKNISTITPDKRTCLITLEALVKCLSPDLKNYFQDICTAELPSVGVVQPCGATVHCGAHHTNPLLCHGHAIIQLCHRVQPSASFPQAAPATILLLPP